MAPCPRRCKRVFPKCPAGCSHGTVVLGALNRWEGQPLSSRSAAAAPQSRATRSILSCATATRASPSRQSRMVCLRPIRRPPSSRLSSYNLHARAYSPASHVTLPRLASVRTMPHAFSVPRDKARPSSSSILARLRSPCPRTAAGTPRRSGVGLTCIVGTVRFPAHILLPGDYRRSESGGLRWLRSGRRGGSAV
jgi:hypothetical protein